MAVSMRAALVVAEFLKILGAGSVGRSGPFDFRPLRFFFGMTQRRIGLMVGMRVGPTCLIRHPMVAVGSGTFPGVKMKPIPHPAEHCVESLGRRFRRTGRGASRQQVSDIGVDTLDHRLVCGGANRVPNRMRA